LLAHRLTNLYNARPTWLELAHKKLDEAISAAYGWKSDLSDEEILEKLLGLILERAKWIKIDIYCGKDRMAIQARLHVYRA